MSKESKSRIRLSMLITVLVLEIAFVAVLQATGVVTLPTTGGFGNSVVKSDSTFYVCAKTAGCSATSDWTQIGTGGGGGAPTDAQYLVLTTNAGLSVQRALVSTSGAMTATDGGANGNYTIDVKANGIDNTRIRTGAGTSVIGVTSTASGNVADITATVDDRVLARTASAVGWASGAIGVTITADAASSTSANTYADCTNLSFPVVSGVNYGFHAIVVLTTTAATTGAMVAINGPAATRMAYSSRTPLSTTSETFNTASAYNTPAASNTASPFTTGNVNEIFGSILPSANGTVIVRFGAEVANSVTVCKAGSSLIYWRQ